MSSLAPSTRHAEHAAAYVRSIAPSAQPAIRHRQRVSEALSGRHEPRPGDLLDSPGEGVSEPTRRLMASHSRQRIMDFHPVHHLLGSCDGTSD